MFKHYERAKDETGEYLKFGNQEIDSSKTHLNYNLAPTREISQGDFVKQRCSEVKCLNRKDVNVMCSWVITAPKTIIGNQEQEQKFFEETYKFLSERYGKENVVSAHVHMDEKTPHVHFAFIPVVTDKKKGHLKVSACEVINRIELQSFHRELEKYMQKAFGYEIGILNDVTKEGNKTITELKLETAQEELSKALNTLEKKQIDIQALTRREKALQGKFEALKGNYDNKVLTQKGLDTIQPEKGVLGGVKNVTLEDIQGLKETASIVVETRAKNSKLKNIIRGLKKQIQDLIQDNEMLKKKVPSTQEQLKNLAEKNNQDIENERMRSELKEIKKLIDKLPPEVKNLITENREGTEHNKSKEQDIDR